MRLPDHGMIAVAPTPNDGMTVDLSIHTKTRVVEETIGLVFGLKLETCRHCVIHAPRGPHKPLVAVNARSHAMLDLSAMWRFKIMCLSLGNHVGFGNCRQSVQTD